MPIDPFKDYTRQEQLDLDLSQIFADGWRDPDGQPSVLVEGIGATSFALQFKDAGLPLGMLGLAVTFAHQNTLAQSKADPGPLIDELGPYFGGVVEAGLNACTTDDDYGLFVQWLANIHHLVRSQP